MKCCALCLQVIQDTVTVVQHVRKERHVPEEVPNIVIGGSYGKPSVVRFDYLARSFVPVGCSCGQQCACLRSLHHVNLLSGHGTHTHPAYPGVDMCMPCGQ